MSAGTGHQRAAEEIMSSATPPWRPIRSREVARLLAVSLQTLANWRVRGTGPEPEPMGTGHGHRTYYRPDKLLAWLDGQPWWRHSGVWLMSMGLAHDAIDDEVTVAEHIRFLERLDVFR
jgi:hypothetical protein